MVNLHSGEGIGPVEEDQVCQSMLFLEEGECTRKTQQ